MASSCRNSTSFCCSRMPFSYVTRWRLRSSHTRIRLRIRAEDAAHSLGPRASRPRFFVASCSSAVETPAVPGLRPPLRELFLQLLRVAEDVGVGGGVEKLRDGLDRFAIAAGVYLGHDLVVALDLAVLRGDAGQFRGLFLEGSTGVGIGGIRGQLANDGGRFVEALFAAA